jgi:hypothetical protein
VDPVRINSIKDFSTPSGLADKVVAVELGRDGVFETFVLAAQESKVANPSGDTLVGYDIRY